jgi:hypothetical protein
MACSAESIGLIAPIFHGTAMALAANPTLGHERIEPTLQSSPIWRRRQASFDLINRDTLGILGDDILLSLVCVHQWGVGYAGPCRDI